MAYLGLVPSEHSSGGARRQGGITRTGNRHARWVLVEAAWNYRFGPGASQRINARRQRVAAGVRSIAQRAEQRSVAPLSKTDQPWQEQSESRDRRGPGTRRLCVGNCPRGPTIGGVTIGEEPAAPDQFKHHHQIQPGGRDESDWKGEPSPALWS